MGKTKRGKGSKIMAIAHPVVVKEVKPKYPQAALQEGKNAVVGLECAVTRAGLPIDVRVLKAGDPAFDDEAVKALKQWEFKPGTLRTGSQSRFGCRSS